MNYQIHITSEKQADAVRQGKYYNWSDFPYACYQNGQFIGGNICETSDWRGGNFTNFTFGAWQEKFGGEKFGGETVAFVEVPGVCNYPCTVYADRIEVGCQTISWESIEKIVAARRKIKRQTAKVTKLNMERLLSFYFVDGDRKNLCLCVGGIIGVFGKMGDNIELSFSKTERAGAVKVDINPCNYNGRVVVSYKGEEYTLCPDDSEAARKMLPTGVKSLWVSCKNIWLAAKNLYYLKYEILG